ncbi:MAG: lipid-binding SYLF domain-containing protein [Burkholderiaceae bacterium]
MNSKTPGISTLVAACTLALASMSAGAANPSTATDSHANPPQNSKTLGNEHQDAQGQVTEAIKVVKQMEKDPDIKQLLSKAQGVFVVPDYGRAALGVGARGGEGVVLVKHGGKWSEPAFYNIGGISGGIQAGVEAGSIALIMNTQKAVNTFKQDNNWSLNADAGLTLVNWSAKAQGNAGRGDVTIWSDAEGLFGDAAVSVTDITFDKDETAAFYGKQVTLNDIFSGKAKPTSSKTSALRQALASASGSGGMSSGSSSGMSDSGMSSDMQTR